MYGSLPCGPAIDGATHGLTDMPLSLIRRGKFHKVPIIIGGNKDDGTVFETTITHLVPGALKPWASSEQDIDLALKWVFEERDISRIKAAYPESEFTTNATLFTPAAASYKGTMSRIARDVASPCSNREVVAA